MSETVDRDNVTPVDEAAEAVVAEPSAHEIQRFRPMSGPSKPFVLLLLAGIIVGALVIAGLSALVMFGVGAFIAFLLMPLVDWMTSRGLSRTVASLIVVVALVAVAVIAGILFFSFVLNQGIPFLKGIPDYLAEFNASVQASANAPTWLKDGVSSVTTGIMEAFAGIDPTQVALGILGGLLGTIGVILGLTILPFFIFYLLTDQPKMAADFRNNVPAPWRPHIQAAVDIVTNDFIRYFKAELVVGSIMFAAVTIGMLVIGAIVGGPIGDFAVLLGLIAGVMELLPQIGPILSLIPALLLAFTTSPLAVVLVGGYYLILFIIEANVLVPSIEGDVIEFSRATVILLIAIGLAVGGIIGGIVALPLAAIARDLFSYIFRQAEQESLIEGTSASI